MAKYNRLLLPDRVALTVREERVEAGTAYIFEPDITFFILMMAELIPIGGVAIAVEPMQRYYPHQADLPKRYRRYLTPVDAKSESVRRTRSFLKPIVDELRIETDFASYARMCQSPNGACLNAFLHFVTYFRKFILAQRENLQIFIALDELRNSIAVLLDVVEHPDSRLNLTAFRSIIDSYEPTDFESITYRSVADDDLVHHVTSIIDHASFRLLSEHSGELGIRGHLEYSRLQIASIAREIAAHPMFAPMLELTKQAVFVAGGFSRSDFRVTGLSPNTEYLPPIINSGGPIDNAWAAWKRIKSAENVEVP